MSRNRRRSPLQSTLKDYLVPIVWGVLILILIYSFLGNDDTTNSSIVPQAWATKIEFSDPDTEAFIIYPWDVKEKITSSDALNIGDTIVVESWSLRLTPDDGNDINLNKIAEFKIEEDGSYNLYSSDAWIDMNQNTNIAMRYANIAAPSNSILSLTQNEAGSTVYVLAGDVKVSNIAGVSTLVTKWQKVSISRQDAAKEDLDLAGSKTSIDSYFKGSDWFIANQGNATLNAADVSITEDIANTGSGSLESTNTWAPIVGGGASTLYLQFDTLKDEMTLSNNTVDITGNILSDSVSSVTINNIQAIISADRKFSLSAVAIPNSVNDLVVKVYDAGQSLVDKQVYTVYSSAEWAAAQTPVTNSAPSTTQTWGTTFEVDATKFGFTAPSITWKFSTTSPEVTIRWYTTADGISKVQVNGFTLNSFNGANWRYHAFKRFTTLKEWSNQYRIDYFGANGLIAYTDYFTIVKNSVVAPAAPTANPATVAPAVSETVNTPSEEESLFSQ